MNYDNLLLNDLEENRTKILKKIDDVNQMDSASIELKKSEVYRLNGVLTGLNSEINRRKKL